eukprot:15433984-Alexandrium_andersonii.AAC.1
MVNDAKRDPTSRIARVAQEAQRTRRSRSWQWQGRGWERETRGRTGRHLRAQGIVGWARRRGHHFVCQ